MKYQYKKSARPEEYSTFTGFVTSEKDLSIIAKDIPCQAACPASTDVPGYIEAISQGRTADAYALNLEDNVFPGVLGRVCTRPCEGSCRHNWTNTQGPVNICHLKRYAADDAHNDVRPPQAWFEDSGKKIAVIGGGPAGLACSRELARYGHSVTLFEKEDHLGGMMVDGIPRFRLPIDVINAETALAVRERVEVKKGAALTSADVEKLAADFDAVVIAAGTVKPNKLDLADLKDEDCIIGLDFMKKYNAGGITHLDGDVVIIGGGFTAVDCARACARAAKRILGKGGEVSIMYRRSEQHLAADEREMEEIEAEQIQVRTLVTPVGIVKKDGKLSAVRFSRNRQFTSESGKPAIEPVAGGDFEVACRHLVVAIGQTQDFSLLPHGVRTEGSRRTSNAKVFLTGDFAYGSKDVISAAADGKKAAGDVDEFLTGKKRLITGIKIEEIKNQGKTGRVRDHDLQAPSVMDTLDVIRRAGGDPEVDQGFNLEEAKSASTRCYFCHYKFEINSDKCIHCDWCIQVAPRECIKRISRFFYDSNGKIESYVEANRAADATFIWIDSNECIRCGKCLRVCPTEAISLVKAAKTTCRAE